MDTTPAAASPPLPTPQTPHFPGYFPETPSDSSTLSSAYDQREPPLDAAGRALPLPTGSVLLGAAAGLLLGGPLGAAAGASLAGLREMERTALSARVGNEAAAPEGQTAVEKEVGGLGGEGDQLLKGAAGAKVLDLEVPQIHTVDVDDAGACALKDQEKVDSSPKPEPILLAAGAGAAVGGLTASALRLKDLREGNDTTSPHGSDVSTERPMSEQHEGEGKMVAGGAAAGVVAGAVGAEALSHDEPQSKFKEALPSSKISPDASSSGFPFHVAPPVPAERSTSTLLAPPVRPTPVSHFSDATFASTASTDSELTSLGPVSDPYDEQRVTLPVVKTEDQTMFGPTVVDSKKDEVKEDQEDEGEKPSRMYGGGLVLPGVAETESKDGERTKTAEDGSTSSWGNETLAARGAGAAVAGTTAYVANERSQTPPPTIRSTGLPHSPKQNDLVHPESISQRTPPGPSRIYHNSHREEPSPLAQIPPVTFAPERSATPPVVSNPVTHSPHMKIATRKDSIGRNRLHKDSFDRGARAGRDRSSSVGEGIWNSSVASVVNNETESRGQRPTLVGVDTEDRREHVLDRVVGVHDPTTSPHSHPTSVGSSPGGNSHHEGESSPSGIHRKLTKSRREGSGHRRAASMGSGDHSPAGSATTSEKSGFLNKWFGEKQ